MFPSEAARAVAAAFSARPSSAAGRRRTARCTGPPFSRGGRWGTFDQLLVSPATPTEIAIAKLLPGCIVGLIHGTIFLLITVFAFGVPFTGSLVLLYAAASLLLGLAAVWAGHRLALLF